MPAHSLRLAVLLVSLLLTSAQAGAQCELTGEPAAVTTLDDRQIIPGADEAIVHLPPDEPGFRAGWAPKGSETSPLVPGGRRVIGGRDTFRYTNRNVPSGQVAELHVVASGISPITTTVAGASKPIVLVIISNGEIARWKLFVAPGTTLTKVVLQGMKGEVEGVPTGAEIVRREPCELHTTGRGIRRQAQNLEYSPGRIQRVLADIRAFTGLVESTFQQGFAPASLVASNIPEAALPVLDHFGPEQMARATETKIIEYMDAVRVRLPEAVRPTVALLIDLVRRSRLPAATFTENGERLPLLWFPPQTAISGSRLECGSNVLIGQGAVRSVKCRRDARIYFMEGKGRTTIREESGDSLIVPGRGASFVSAGSGRDLIVLERGWGIVSLSKTCAPARSKLVGRRPPFGMIHSSFLVFGAGVRPTDLVWLPLMRRKFRGHDGEGATLVPPMRVARLEPSPPRVLVNRATRDILILRQPCFNLVFHERGRLVRSPWLR